MHNESKFSWRHALMNQNPTCIRSSEYKKAPQLLSPKYEGRSYFSEKGHVRRWISPLSSQRLRGEGRRAFVVIGFWSSSGSRHVSHFIRIVSSNKLSTPEDYFSQARGESPSTFLRPLQPGPRRKPEHLPEKASTPAAKASAKTHASTLDELSDRISQFT